MLKSILPKLFGISVIVSSGCLYKVINVEAIFMMIEPRTMANKVPTAIIIFKVRKCNVKETNEI